MIVKVGERFCDLPDFVSSLRKCSVATMELELNKMVLVLWTSLNMAKQIVSRKSIMLKFANFLEVLI